MSVLVVRTSREMDTLVAIGEPNVKVRHKRMNVIIALGLQAECGLVVDLFLGDIVKIDTLERGRGVSSRGRGRGEEGGGVLSSYQDHAMVRHNVLLIHTVHQRLEDGTLTNAGHIKAPHIGPPVDFIFLVFLILNTAHTNAATIRQHHTTLFLHGPPGVRMPFE